MIAAAVTFIAVIIFVFGISFLFSRNVNPHRFGKVKYSHQDDKQLQQINLQLKKKNPLTASKFILLTLIGGIFLFGATYIFTGLPNIALLASFGGILVPKAWLGSHRKKQEKLISAQAEQALEAMATVIKSGGGIYEALDKAASNTDEPMRSEIEFALSEMKLGIAEDEAFLRLSERVDVPEMTMLNVASIIRKEGVAVNMASVLENIQSNIRKRQAFAEEIRALTSENRLAVWIVAAVPFFTVGVIRFMSPEFIDPLFNTPIGLMVFLMSVIMIAIGIFWALKIADSSSVI